ncbi:MAG TPA: tetratricopeptide repeat protein, partial [Myxococcales bacterium]|nr:tetratricopeptide repeat protein [Myxococcales bacterium]
MPPSTSSEGNRLLAAGMYQEAIASFEAALKNDPADARCLLGLAKAFIAQKHDDQALQTLDALMKVKPDHLEARSQRAGILVRKGDPAGPAELAAAAGDRRSGYEEHYAYGTYLLGQNQDDKALKEFEACARIEGRDARAFNALGTLAMRRKDYVAAVNHFLKATQLAAPKDPFPFLFLARAYRFNGQGTQSAGAYLEALNRYRDDNLLEEAYQACIVVSELDTALKVVLMARESKPQDAKYSRWMDEVMNRLKARGAKKTGAPAYDEGDASAISVDKEVQIANDLLNRNPPTPPPIAKEAMVHLDRVLRINAK